MSFLASAIPATYNGWCTHPMPAYTPMMMTHMASSLIRLISRILLFSVLSIFDFLSAWLTAVGQKCIAATIASNAGGGRRIHTHAQCTHTHVTQHVIDSSAFIVYMRPCSIFIYACDVHIIFIILHACTVQYGAHTNALHGFLNYIYIS